MLIIKNYFEAMEYIYGGIIGYLIGSFPTALLLLKLISKKNILFEGSKSSGALNAFRVSESKSIGLLVVVIDLFKGILPILIIKYLFNYTFELLAVTSIFSVLGHCFSVWIKFKGGRGIATASGALLLISPLVLLIWVIIWLVGFAYKKNAHIASVASSILTAILCFSSAEILAKYSFPNPSTNLYFSFLISMFFFVILLKHYETIFLYFSKSDKKN